DFSNPSATTYCRQYDVRAGPRWSQQQGIWVEIAASSYGKAGHYRSQQKVKCAFAHGARDLRSPAAGRTAPPKMDKTRQHRGLPTGDTTTPCCDSRCTVHHHFVGDETRTPKDNSFTARRDANNSCNGCTCRQPLQEFGTKNQPQAHDGTNPVPRGTFSLWESPNAILQGPTVTLGWTDPNAAYPSSSNIKDKANVLPSTEERCFRGTLREDETWAKIARAKSRRVGGGADGVSTQTSSLTSNLSEAERTERCLGVMSEAATDAAVCARSSKERCRSYYSSSNGNALTATDLGPMPTTVGLSLDTNGRSPSPFNLGPPSFASAPSQSTPASLSTSHCWNPLAYENSLLGKPSASTPHPSTGGNAGHQTSGPSVAPSDQHHVDDARARMMSDVGRVSSLSDDSAGGGGGRSLDDSMRMLPWAAPLFLQPATGSEESRPLQPTQQLGGRFGDSSRPGRSYRTNISSVGASPDMDTRRASTAFPTEVSRESNILSFPKDGQQPALPTTASRKNNVVRVVAATNPSPSPSPFDWGLESSASFTPVSNNVLKYPTGGFPPSSW
ncbi:unnamed protein product, partial [Ectocarpus fasciculatus]